MAMAQASGESASTASRRRRPSSRSGGRARASSASSAASAASSSASPESPSKPTGGQRGYDAAAVTDSTAGEEAARALLAEQNIAKHASARRSAGAHRGPAVPSIRAQRASSSHGSALFSTRMLLLLFFSLALRLAAFAHLPGSVLRTLSTRVELVSPSTSFASLSEGIYLLRAYEHQQATHKRLASLEAQQRNDTIVATWTADEQQENDADARRLRGLAERLRTPNPWASGQVHHAPLLVHALKPFVPSPAVALHADISVEEEAARKARRDELALKRRRQAIEADRRRASVEALRDVPVAAGAGGGTIEAAWNLLEPLLSLQPYHYVWAALDVLAAFALAIVERQRARWRSKYGRIRDVRELQMQVEAKLRAERQVAAQRGSNSHAEHAEPLPHPADRTLKVAALYLLNPLSLLTTLALSTTTLFNFLSLVTLLFANTLSGIVGTRRPGAPPTEGEESFAAQILSTLVLPALVSFQLVVSPFSLLVLPPIILLAGRYGPAPASQVQQQTKAAAAAAAAAAATADRSPRASPMAAVAATTVMFTFALLLLNLGPLAHFNISGVLDLQYAHQFLLTDLTPNIGLWWYFFIEMFDHFRNFFLLAFNVHLAAYTVPLSIRCSDDPLFAVTILTGIFAVFQPYPTLGNTALYLSLLALHPEIYPYLRYPMVTALLYSYSLFLLPLFHHLWLHAGSGNANFFYAITLVWALAGSFGILDALWAWGRLAWERERDSIADGGELRGIDEKERQRVVVQL